jgi:hypothetical protein
MERRDVLTSGEEKIIEKIFDEILYNRMWRKRRREER